MGVGEGSEEVGYLSPNSCPSLVEDCPLSVNFLVFAAPPARENPQERGRGKPWVCIGTGRAKETAFKAGTVVCIVQMRTQRLKELVSLPPSSRSL